MKSKHLLTFDLVATIGTVIACGNENTSDTSSFLNPTPTPAPVDPVDPVELEYQEVLTMEGRNAGKLFEALFVRAENGTKVIEDNGSITCQMNIPEPIPNGIVAPTADCVGQTSASIANGIIAPWFTLSGFAGLELQGKLPGDADRKTLKGDLKIECSAEACTISKKSEGEPEVTSFAVEGPTADSIAASMERFFGDNGVNGSQGNVTCRLIQPNIPDGAQGFFFPTAQCSGHPHIQDPRVGIVAPWFTLDGQLGMALYRAMPVEAAGDLKSIDGEWTIQCEDSRCEFSWK